MVTANGTKAIDELTAPPPVEQGVEVPSIEILRMEITVIGDSPLICHRWAEKAKKEMLDKQMKRAKRAKEAKDPNQLYEDSLYKLDGGGYGFPSIGFKSAAVAACRFTDLKMTVARGAFFVEGEFVKLTGEPTMREDMVKIAMGTADIRYRGEFKSWRAVLPISYNAAVFSPAQIVNLINLGGFGVGVGEWRPERDGQYGRFHVATDAELKAA